MFNVGDEVVVVDYPDTELIGKTGIIDSFDGMYWNVDLDEEVDEDEGTRYLLETKEIEPLNTQYKYDPSQAGDTDDDV